MPTSFLEIQFPVTISWGAKGGPRWQTRITTHASGYEQRVEEWSKQRARYEVGHEIKTTTALEELITFFDVCRGQAYGFRFKDWGDYRASLTNTEIQIGTGDGTTTEFQLTKTYTNAAGSYVRTINKPVNNGTLRVYKAAVLQTVTVDYTIDYTTGIITFVVAPTLATAVKAYFEFDVPCRFDTDDMDYSLTEWNVNDWVNIPIVELKL
jgi:uncharacterized protein (TIGR02217 family)